jgi:DNA-binding NtrC family response regulator
MARRNRTRPLEGVKPCRPSPEPSRQTMMATRQESLMPLTTVLVIDDLEGIRDSLAEVLRLHGYQVLTAGSVPEAEAVREHRGLGGLDVVITNLRLTRRAHAREGADLIQRWHTLAPRLPFILISADVRPDELADLPAGVVRCVAKPFTIAEVLATVQAALGR